MKKYIALVLILVLFLSVPFVSAATSDGLEWGINEGDQLNFIFSYEDYNVSIKDESVYIEVSELPTIPDHINELTELVPAFGYVYFANGTSVNETLLTVGGLVAAMPIGNWSYLTSLVSEYDPPSGSVTVIDNATCWGYELDAPGASTEFTVYKIDGSVGYYYMQAGFVTTLLIEVELIRTDPPTTPEPTTESTSTESTSSGPPTGGFPFDTTTLLLIGVGAVAVVVIIVVVVKMRK